MIIKDLIVQEICMIKINYGFRNLLHLLKAEILELCRTKLKLVIVEILLYRNILIILI